jgi:HlyD family secretion protein
MKKTVIVPGVIAVVVIAVVVFLIAGSNGKAGVISVSGNIEATTSELSFKIPGIVRQRLVTEGDAVKQGQLIAVLDDKDLQQQVSLRAAELQAAEAVLAELKAGTRPEEIAVAEAMAQQAQAKLAELTAGARPQEIAAAQAAVDSAQAQVTLAKTDFDRKSHLSERGTITRQEFDASKTAYDTALARLTEAQEQFKLVKAGPRQEQIDQAKAALKQAEANYAMAKAGPRQEDIDQAVARVEQAKASKALAETQVGYAKLTAPFAGIVLSKNAEEGEFVAPGTPVVTVGDLSSVWMRAYIEETDLGRVKLGMDVNVKTDTFSGKAYRGRLTFISSEAEFTPKNVQTKKERVKLVYRVKVDIPNLEQELKPGMPADADILVTKVGR